jgi:hypothetical protein
MAGPLSAAITREIGVETEPRINPDTGSVGTSVVRVLPGNPNRFAFVVINLGTAAVYLRPDRDVSASAGIRLAPSGGSFAANWREDFHIVGWDWYAIADAAAQSIFVLEVVAR